MSAQMDFYIIPTLTVASLSKEERKDSLKIRFRNKFILLLGKCHLILLTALNEKNLINYIVNN